MREELIDEVLSLPPEERAYVADCIHDSLLQDPDEPKPYEGLSGEAYIEELKRRSAEHWAGKGTAKAKEEVLERLRKMYGAGS